MGILASQPSPIGWRFWVAWMLATVAGATAFILVTIPLNAIMAAPPLESGAAGPRGGETWLLVAVVVLSNGMMGALFGLGQWLVLRQYLPHTGLWILATLFGYAIPLSATTLYGARPSEWGPLWMALEFGLMVGVPQWLVLHHRIHQAGWWIAITLAGWMLAFGFTGAAYLSGMYIEPLDMLSALLIPVATAGAGMVWLIRRGARVSGIARRSVT